MKERAGEDLAALLVNLHKDLLLWALRRPMAHTGREFGTTRGNVVWPFLALITVTTPVEILAAELLLPRELWWLRIVLVVAAVELLLLAWALYASLVRHPIVVGGDGLWLRWGAFLRYRLAYSFIEDAQVASRPHPTGQFGVVFYPPHRPEGYLSNSSRVNVTLKLASPVLLPGGRFTRGREVQLLHLGVDSPDEFADAVMRRRKERPDGEIMFPAVEPASRGTGKSGHGGLWLLLLSLTLEGLLALFGLLWIGQQGRHLPEVVGFSWEGMAGGTLAGAAAFGVTTLVYKLLSPRFSPLMNWRRWVDEQLVPFLEPAGVWTALGIAISAGVGEELLFRGAMQPVLGLPVTALIFALAHVGGLLRREALPLFLYTLFFGLIGGWAYHQIGVLWPLIVAHAALDFFMILYLRRQNRATSITLGR